MGANSPPTARHCRTDAPTQYARLAFEGSVTSAFVRKPSRTPRTASSRCCPEGKRFDNDSNCRYKFSAYSLLAKGTFAVILASSKRPPATRSLGCCCGLRRCSALRRSVAANGGTIVFTPNVGGTHKLLEKLPTAGCDWYQCPARAARTQPLPATRSACTYRLLRGRERNELGSKGRGWSKEIM